MAIAGAVITIRKQMKKEEYLIQNHEVVNGGFIIR
jgi:hypothetical protein